MRHFTHAASALGVAQPSLSQQVTALERDLGAALFSRARGNITLTAAGEALLPPARRILADVDTVRREVQDLTGLRRPGPGPGLHRTVALAHRKDVRATHAAQAFRETLLRHIRDEAASTSLPPGVHSLLA